MKKLNRANFKRTLHYLRRNGLRAAYYAAGERLTRKENEDYEFHPPKEELLNRQKNRSWEYEPLFSIVVPLYKTPEKYLRELLQSVLNQTYGNWELVLVDASEEEEGLEEIVRSYPDKRIRYTEQRENWGISENTNAGIEICRGDYIGLLDHDDVLAADALYEMADRIEKGKKAGTELLLLYSDEDKCSEEGDRFFEPHFKEKFNLDLLLSNNYICHFLMLESRLMKNLMLRPALDGAQDYDLVLRAVAKILPLEEAICHIPKVLYHWRCHAESTAENPQSKEYAYLGGKEALRKFVEGQGWQAQVVMLRHLGFYGLDYKPDILSVRKDVGAVGGRLIRKNKIAGGIYKEDGTPLYLHLNKNYSGYMHRAALLQDADAVDIRLIQVRKECRTLFKQVTGVEYKEREGGKGFDISLLPPETDFLAISLALSKALRQAGYRLVWDPGFIDPPKRMRGMRK